MDTQHCPCCGAWLAVVGRDIVLMEEALEWERERDMDSRIARERAAVKDTFRGMEGM